MEPSLSAHTLLPDLPNDEPWLELKFHLQELDGDSSAVLRRLLELKPLLNVPAEARRLHDALFDIYGAVHHHAKDHARRAMELAGGLLLRSPDSIPEWEPGKDGAADFAIPPEVSACTSLDEARARLSLHVEELTSAVDKASQAVLRAAGRRGSRQEVLEAVRDESSTIYQSLHDVALPHAQGGYCWSEQYWRLADPEGASAYDKRAAEIDAEMAALEDSG
jgi:hypothetical protein